MNRSQIIILALALATALPATAQRRRTTKTPAVPLMEQAQQALASYDFESAEELLESEIAALKKKRQPTQQAEKMLRVAEMGRTKLHATERIVIIDSLVCDMAEVLRAIRLSHESGRIDTYASTYHTADNTGATLYENELANKRFLAMPSNPLRLAFTDKLGDSWSSPVPLTGLCDDEDTTDDYTENYPFLLSDGVTLYYAATGDGSIGGYDIFVTRADGEDGSFLAPENIGFPFNSPANDYLYAIDELNQLGWFVSDRNQPEGKVCVYTFIPNDTRQTYNEDFDDATLQARARITSIRDTWSNNPGEVEAAQGRLADVRSGKAAKANAVPDFVFPIDDRRTYTSLADFRSSEARQKMQKWIELRKTIDTDEIMLSRLRDNYAKANAAERTKIAPSIRRIEDSLYPQQEELRQLAKAIRNAEISHK